MNRELLNLRNKLKAKKPSFHRQDANIMKHLRGKWRKPKGIHSKLREHRKGHGNLPAVGYGSPHAVKGLTRQGFFPVLVSNVTELKNVKEGCAAVLGSGVGKRKKVEIVLKAQEMNIKILGIHADEFVKNVQEQLVLRKKKSTDRKDYKKKKTQTLEKKQDKPVKTEEKKDELKK